MIPVSRCCAAGVEAGRGGATKHGADPIRSAAHQDIPASQNGSPGSVPAVSGRRHAAALIIIAAAVVIVHGPSLGDGLFLDDHWHQLQYEQRGWSVRELLDATTIEPARFMHSWWQDRQVRWQYARPLWVALAKGVYDLSDANVAAQHAVSVALHLASALMVYGLCFALTRHAGWSAVGGLIYSAYSHATITVAWLAAQNAVLQTALTLAALLLYIRGSGLQFYQPPLRDGPAPAARRGMLLSSVFVWTLALLSRENAIVLPAFLIALDLAFGGRRHVWTRLPVYALFALIGSAFACWRLIFEFHPMPDVYMRRPDGPGYALWLGVKLLHYICSAVWLSPMTVGPSGRYDPIDETPGDCILMAAIVGVMGVGYYLACRNARGWWLWPLWILLSVLPVVPLMAAPHSGYMAAPGFAIAMVLGPALRARIRPVLIGRWCGGVAIWFLIATHAYIPIYRNLWMGMCAAERCTTRQLTAFPPSPGVTDVFFINLPFVNVYSQLGFARIPASASSRIRLHVLTYAPDVLRMDQRFRIERRGERVLSVAVDGRGYFSGYLGRFLLDGMRHGGRFERGEIVRGELFDARVVEADEHGVARIEFVFHKPLDSPEYGFYVASQECPAARLTFADEENARMGESPEVAIDASRVVVATQRLARGDVAASDALFAGLAASDPGAREDARRAVRRLILPIVRGLGGPVPESGDDDALDEFRQELRQWWRNHVTADTLDEFGYAELDIAPLRAQRDRLYRIREIAGQIIRSDLYLSGPPFPGPRSR